MDPTTLMAEALRRENFTGGWLVLSAYGAGLLQFGRIRRAKRTDFLSDEEIARFETRST